MDEKHTIKHKKPFNTPPTPPGEEPDSDDDTLAGYQYTLDNGTVIHLLIGSNRDERGNFWEKYSVAQGVKKRRKSNKRKRKSNKRKKTNKKRRNYRK
jgi:hypothetical protein